MSGFDDREVGFESKFDLDQEFEFKVNSHMAHLYGLWVAENLGLTGKEADDYANTAVGIEITKAGHVHLLDKTEKDLLAKGVVLSRHRLEREMQEFHARARKDILSQLAN